MEFRPKNKENYYGDSFQLVGDDSLATVEPGELTTLHGYPAHEWVPLPFPLPKNGRITITEDATYDRVRSEASVPDSLKVFVARSDEKLEEVSELHFVRVYAPQEMRQAARNLEQYLAGHGCRPMSHSCCKSLSYTEITIEVASTLKSPFADATDALIFNKRVRNKASPTDNEQSGKYLECMPLVIAAMLELIKKLNGPSYNKTKVNKELRELLSKDIYRGLGETRINHAFAEATKAKEDAERKAGVFACESDASDS
jgi:hypothetical protein